LNDILLLSETKAIAVGGDGFFEYNSPANATATKLIVGLPNKSFLEEFSDLTNPNISGVANSVKAGDSVSFNTYAIDESNKLDRGIKYLVRLSSDDPNAQNTSSFNLDNNNDEACNSGTSERIENPCGIGIASYVFHTPGDWTVTSTDSGGSGLTQGYSSIIHVNPGDPSKTTITVDSTAITAGEASGAVLLTLTDLYGNISPSINGDSITLASNSQNGRFSTSSTGPWTNTLNLDIAAGNSSSSFYYLDYASGSSVITASAIGFDSSTLTFVINSGFIDPLKSLVTLSASSVVANNTEVSVTTTLLDSNSNKVSDKEIRLTSNRAEDTVVNPASLTNSQGQTTGTIKSTKTGVSNITIYDATDNVYLPSASLTFTPGPSEKISLENYPTEIEAGAPFSVKAVMKDKYDNTDTGYTGTLSLTSNDTQANLSQSHTFSSQDSGIYTFENIILKTAGLKTITLSDPSGISSSFNITVKPTAYSATSSSLTLNHSSIKADSKDQAIATVALHDLYSNVLSGKKVTLSSSLAGVNITPTIDSTNTDGEVNFVITSTAIGSTTLTASVEGETETLKSNLTFISSNADLAKSSAILTVSSIKASGKEYTLLEISLKDSQGNPIPREDLVITTSRPETDTITEVTGMNLKDIQSDEETPVSFIPHALASTPEKGITVKTNNEGQSKIKITSSKEGTSVIVVTQVSTGTKIAELSLTVMPLSPVEASVQAVKDVISAISSSPVAQKIAKFTEPIISTVATISLLPIIANVFSTVPQIFNFFSYLSISILEATGLRRKRQPWGRVYNSITGKPIDLAVVRIFNEKKKLVETRVTDFEGRFGFIVPKGKYTLTVAKETFKFPSEVAEARASHFNDKYQLSSDIYLGTPISVSEQNANINLDIPLDPILKSNDLRIRIRLAIRLVWDWFEIIISYLAKPFLFVGVAISIFNYLVHSTSKNLILLFIYLVLLVFLFIKYHLEAKSFGTVIDQKTNKPIAKATVSIYDKEYNTLRQSQVTDKEGRFHFLVRPGTYYLSVEAPGYKMIDTPKKSKLTSHIYNGADIAYSKPGYVNVEILMEGEK
jgi:hypothetical protein